MQKSFLLSLVLITGCCSPILAQQKVAFQPSGVVVLDNTDPWERGKVNSDNKLTLVDLQGKKLFRNSGLSVCESIGSSHAIATDPVRLSIWVIENVGHCIRRYDLSGKETLKIANVHGSSIAVDVETGNLWALVGPHLNEGAVVIYNTRGEQIKTIDVTGWDIVYDRKAKAFWVADKELKKIDAATGKVFFSIMISQWTATTLDVDQTRGHAWVHVSEHTDIRGTKNRLLKFDERGAPLLGLDRGELWCNKIAVDSVTGSCWLRRGIEGIERLSAEGKSETVLKQPCLTLQVERQGSHLWLVTADEIQKTSPEGKVVKRMPLSGKTTMAWIGLLE